jgi:hypothetical protein
MSLNNSECRRILIGMCAHIQILTCQDSLDVQCQIITVYFKHSYNYMHGDYPMDSQEKYGHFRSA